MGNTVTRVIDRPSCWSAAQEQAEIDSWERDGWELHKILPDRLYFKRVAPKPTAEPTGYPNGFKRYDPYRRRYQTWNGYRFVPDSNMPVPEKPSWML
jgi:hypothetical protein